MKNAGERHTRCAFVRHPIYLGFLTAVIGLAPWATFPYNPP
jgi:hypothetical protein